ncbi:hypothetical protein [Pyxidicoccus trucidator]|uniref:hypothetical protein n=1 Tax=Pyxidicoccus trucidator TaxID=2709662 RepID=UPI0013DCDE08|nr:hypothetical protein [Pyxidicoccus trucidator]
MSLRSPLLLAAVLLLAPHARAEDGKPEHVLSLLLTTFHGASELGGPEVLSALARVKQEPDTFIPLLLQELEEARLEEAAGDAEAARRMSSAAGLLAGRAGPKGRDALESLLPEWQKARDEHQAFIEAKRKEAPSKPSEALIEELRKHERALRLLARLEHSVLRAMSGTGDARFAEVLLERLLSEAELALVYVDHLILVAPNSSKVQQALAELMEKTEDPDVALRIEYLLKHGKVP